MIQDRRVEASPRGWYCRTVFFVEDIQQSIDFYGERLGFSERWKHEDVAAQVDREGLELILNRDGQRAGKGRVFLSLGPGQTHRLEKELRSSGTEVSFTRWGMNVMVVADPDGNELYFTDDELTDG